MIDLNEKYIYGYTYKYIRRYTKMEAKKILHKIELVRNPKTGKGWVYNLTDDTWMRAINPVFSKRGVLISGLYPLEEGKKYLVKVDNSSWSNSWEDYQVLTVVNGEVKELFKFKRNNGTYNFKDNKVLEEKMAEYSLTLETSGEEPGEAVKVNVLDFAKFLIKGA